ncbi:hypothetical protein [Jejuia pallidilutea]|uniref:LysM domain protein n=1 Tax=Jejuia pallidilutea TaxID=504487 RepID=A0A090W787_9FLAO|nr:LysM domain protein [Jejuia pallidilutea]
MVKNIASYLLLALTICILVEVSFPSVETVDLSRYSTDGLVLNYTVSHDANMGEHVKASKDGYETFSPFLGKSFVGFKEALAFSESGGNYRTINSYGYLGKYQFGKETLKLIGVRNIQKFLK